MNTGIISKAISNIVEAQFEKKSEGFTMVNVRPGEKVSAMLDVLAHLYQKSPSAVIADALSQRIATHAASSEMYADAILDAAGQVLLEREFIHEESALGILKEQGLIKVKYSLHKPIKFGIG